MTPKVQSLAQIMAELQPAISGQQKVIQQQQEQLGVKTAAQKKGLAAEKVQGFNDINTQATGRGVSFSGIPLDEQATYLSTKYLPAVAALDQAELEGNTAFSGQLADLYSSLYSQAFGERGNQRSELNSWNKMLQEQKFTAGQNAQDRAAAASRAAADRAPTGPDNATIIANLNNWATGAAGNSRRTGGDGKLSPSDFKAGFQVAAQYGMDVDTYVAVMQRYVNTSHAKDYVF